MRVVRTKDNIEKVLLETGYVYKEKYPDDQLNRFYNYWYFLEEHEEELRGRKNTSLETILYSKYYWFLRLSEKFYEIYGFDAGMEQQQFLIIEELEQRLDNVDWALVELLQYENV